MKWQRNLRFYWRTHLAIGLGVAVTAVVIIGSLLVGDVVRHSLASIAEARLGPITHTVVADGRFFHQRLAEPLRDELDLPVAPALLLKGVVEQPDSERRAFDVTVWGIDEHFAALTGEPAPPPADGLQINQTLADNLGVAVGDALLVQIPKPSWLPSEAPMSPDEDDTLDIRLPIARILPAAELGDVNLAANQQPAKNCFIPLAKLQEAADYPEQVNLFFFAAGETATEAIDQVLADNWRPTDVGLEIIDGPGVGVLRSKRIFMQEAIAERLPADGVGVLTYLVDELNSGEQMAPYSMVAAVEPGLFDLQDGPEIPADWPDDGILINQWLADDLGIGVGAPLTLAYKELTPNNELVPATADFTVAGVLPMTGAAADQTLMPPFPGIAEADNCAEWDPGTEMDLDKIRDQDEAYWDEHKGTPKAFITLAAGQRLWGNRYGSLTDIRFPAAERERWIDELRAVLNPARFGLYAQDIKARQQAALGGSMNIGMLFNALSFFLILSALLITGLLFAFALTRRRREIGTLLAVGYPVKRVGGMLMREHLAVAAIGVVVGAVAAVGYTRVLVWALNGVWSDVIGGVSLTFVLTGPPFIVGAVIVIALAWLVFYMRLRSLGKESILALLHGEVTGEEISRRSRIFSWSLAAVSAIAALGTMLSVEDLSQATMPYFGAGFGWLVAGLAVIHALSGSWVHSGGVRSLNRLAIANLARRWGRSYTVIILLALASFLVLAIGAHFKHTDFDPREHSSGTGGFPLMMTTSLPVDGDLNVKEDWPHPRPGVAHEHADYVSFRTLQGDEASCRNLNRAQRPTLWGADPADLDGRFTFTGLVGDYDAEGWDVLAAEAPADEVLAVADMNTLMWALQKPLGSALTFNDEFGEEFKVRIVGQIADSTFQGGLVISEEAFLNRYPSKGGYQRFLIETPPEQQEAVADRLRKILGDRGPDVFTSQAHLNQFNQIQNMYMAVFQVLGALGLLLGSLGLVVILLRNVEERRGEFATMRALGFSRARLLGALLVEHLPLIAGGLGLGLIAAILGVIPAFARSGGTGAAGLAVLLLLGAVVLVGLLALLIAAWQALRQPLLGDLRRE